MTAGKGAKRRTRRQRASPGMASGPKLRTHTHKRARQGATQTGQRTERGRGAMGRATRWPWPGVSEKKELLKPSNFLCGPKKQSALFVEPCEMKSWSAHRKKKGGHARVSRWACVCACVREGWGGIAAHSPRREGPRQSAQCAAGARPCTSGRPAGRPGRSRGCPPSPCR